MRTDSLYERVAKATRERYWLERRGILGCADPLPSEQVESLMKVLCEEVEDLFSSLAGDDSQSS